MSSTEVIITYEYIKNPLPTIYEFLAKRNATRRMQKKFDTQLMVTDVLFNTDKEFIEEIAKEAEISYELAEKIATMFFEEIKKGMIEGNVVNIERLGKFYINGLHHNYKHEVVDPGKEITPKFKAALRFKRKILKYESSQ